jgi:hypothetical protein
MKFTGFGDVLKIGKFFSDVKGLLHTTGVQNITYISRLPHGSPLGRTNSVFVEGRAVA